MNQKGKKAAGSSSIGSFITDKKNRRIIFVGLGVVELCLVLSIAVVFLKISNTKIPNILAFASPAPVFPTPACVQPVLTVGSTSFPVQIIKRSADGSVTIPSGNSDKAFWVDGTKTSMVFGLSPSPNAISLQTSLKAGDRIHIVWADCSMDDYVVKAVQGGQPDSVALLDQSVSGVRVFVQNSASAGNFVIVGVNLQAMVAPTASCDVPVLTLRTSKYQIQPVEPSPDGSFAALTGDANIAYWYKGASANYVFSLSPSKENLAMEKTLQAGDLISITDTKCNITTYTLSAPEPGAVYTPTLSNQPADGLVLFIQNAPAGEGFVVRGGPVAEQVIPTSTPAPGGPGVEAEISLLETSTSPDKATIHVRVSIRNYGASAFAVTPNDVLLELPDSGTVKINQADPALPQTVDPGVTSVISFTFPRPSTATAVIRIFSAEYDLEGY